MARLSDIPISSFTRVFNGFKESENVRKSYVRICIELEDGAPSSLVGAIKDALMPEAATALVHVDRLKEGETLRVSPDCDLAIVVCGTNHYGLSAAKAIAKQGIACAVVMESSVEVEVDGLPDNVALLCASSSSALLQKLAEWMISSTAADLALASNFSFIRPYVSSACVKEKSIQNAIVGAIPFGNGADMPIMAANQVLMSLDVAGAYGKEANSERLAEVAGVLGAAYLSRSLARKVTGKLPGLDWLIRASIGSAVTYGIGQALILRFHIQDTWKTRQ